MDEQALENTEAPPRVPPSYEELNQLLYVTKRQLQGLTQQSRDLQEKINSTRKLVEQHKHFSTSVSFQLGKLLLDSSKSPDGLKALPKGLLQLLQLSRQRRAIRQAKALLDANGYRVVRTQSAVQTAAATASARVAADYRVIFDSLVELASAIPESNGSQYYRPIALNVAIVTDEFMFNYYRSIFQKLIYVTPDSYEEAFRNEDIHLFLYVSCWSGIANDEWRGIAYRQKPKEALNSILALSKTKGIPTVFQTIEDPSNYEHYLPVARLFNHIVTTDAECIARYQRDTEASSVSYGEYGVNPMFNNPIGIRRKEHPGAFFAGSYPSRYAERCHDMHVVFDSLMESKCDLVIADRNSDKPSQSVAFPARYSKHLVPKVGHQLLQKIHKVFKYNINFNSIKNSPTMCAMRIYELQAQGSLLMSNYAKSVVNNFPVVDIINSKVDTSAYFRNSDILGDYEKRVASIRTIMTNKTGFEQARVMLANIGVDVAEQPVPLVVVIATSVDAAMREMFERQKYPNKRLVSVAEAGSIELPDHAYYACFSSMHEYEENYLTDMVNGFKYTNSRYVTKAAYFDDATLQEGPQHEFVEVMPSIYRTVFDAGAFELPALLSMPDNSPCPGGYAIDPFELNYSRFVQAHRKPVEEYALSVIVPVYNNGEFLRWKCMESLRRNALFPRMEIILVDDGSTDRETLATIVLLQRRYGNVRVFSFGDGGSGSASRPRNKGVQLATARLVSFLDPDNEISPKGYDRLHAIFVAEEAKGRPLDLVAGYQIKVGSAQTVTAKHTNGPLVVFEDPRNSFLLTRKFPIVSTQAAVIQKDFLLRTQIDFVQNAVGQDTLYGHELLAHASRVGFTGDAHIVYYAERIDSVTNSLNLRFFQKSLILEKAQHARLEKAGLLQDYIDLKFQSFFEGWYLQKLKLTSEEIRPAAREILDEILMMYGFPPSSFEETKETEK